MSVQRSGLFAIGLVSVGLFSSCAWIDQVKEAKQDFQAEKNKAVQSASEQVNSLINGGQTVYQNTQQVLNTTTQTVQKVKAGANQVEQLYNQLQTATGAIK